MEVYIYTYIHTPIYKKDTYVYKAYNVYKDLYIYIFLFKDPYNVYMVTKTLRETGKINSLLTPMP